MNSIIEGKRGGWYEEEFVVHQLLRLLSGEISWLRWEDPNDLHSGVDLVLRESERTIAVQCKHHSATTWTASLLRPVLQHALRQVESESADEFRFVTDARAPLLERVLREVCAASHPPDLQVPAHQDLLAALGLPGGVENAERFGRFCRTMKTALIDADQLAEMTRALTWALMGGRPEELHEHLRQIARKNVGMPLERPRLLSLLADAGMELPPRIDSGSTATVLQKLRLQFVEEVRLAAALLPLDEIPRSEVVSLQDAIESAERGATIVLHGPAGCGKSNLLASVLEKLDLPVLPLRAGREPLFPAAHRTDPVGTLLSFCGDRRGVLLIDQLDQLRIAGPHAQTQMASLRGWVRDAQRCGLIVLVGCRTVDAERDTQLKQLLEGDARRPTTRIPVHDLPESDVVDALAARGVAANDLGAALLRILSRPLALGLFLSLRDDFAEASRCRSALELMRRWWEKVALAKHPNADRVLEELCTHMEERGRLSCPVASLRDQAVVNALVDDGILQRDNGSVRPFHQLLTDTRIAVRWGGARSLDAFLSGIGPRAKQGLVQARRLRLSIPLLADEPGVLRDAFDSPQIRPLLKHALLSGLAELEQPSADTVKIVRSWAQRPESAGAVFEWVVHGQRHWATALAGEIDVAWSTGTVPQNVLLRLLASIDDGSQPVVDRLLKKWCEQDPNVLAQAHLLFRAAPELDSDERFETRLRLEAMTQRAVFAYTDWSKLVRARPDRAARLLAVRLQHCPDEVLRQGDQSTSLGLPHESTLNIVTEGFGASLFRELTEWWNGLQIDPEHVYAIDDEYPELRGVLATIVEILARALAVDLVHGTLALESVIRQLPDPQRDLDGWLLLAIAAHLPEYASELASSVADQLAHWYVSDPRWCTISGGQSLRGSGMELPKKALGALGILVTDDCLRELEAFLIRYPDAWSAEADRQRGLRPNARGLTAARLLPALPAERLSPNARRFLHEAQRKFGELDFPLSSGGPVRSPILDEVADRWSANEWADAFRRAPINARMHFEEHGATQFSERMLAQQLGSLARRNPQRYFEIARGFDETTPVAARNAILWELGSTRPPDGRTGDWAPLDDESVATLLQRSCYLSESGTARAVAWTVHSRPTYPWPSMVIDRLCEIAMVENAKAPEKDNTEEGYAHYRINDEACSAIEALAACAMERPDLHAKLLELGVRLSTHPDHGRRASAAALAMTCRSANRERANELLLFVAQEPTVAAENDIANWLFHLAADAEATGRHRHAARDLLLRLCDSSLERIGKLGGSALFALRLREVIDDATLEAKRNANAGVAGGVTAAVCRALHSPEVLDPPRSWILNLALRLADEGPPSGHAVVASLGSGRATHLLEDRVFLERLLPTRSATECRDSLIHACDRMNQLLPIADLVLTLATAAAEVDAPIDAPLLGSTEIAALVSRLVEEAEAAGDSEVLTRALDTWDVLLQTRSGPAMRSMLVARLTS